MINVKKNENKTTLMNAQQRNTEKMKVTVKKVFLTDMNAGKDCIFIMAACINI